MTIQRTARPGFTLVTLATIALLAGCSSKPEGPVRTEGQARVDFELLHTLPDEAISFNDEVRPVLESRCIVCHGCFDAPCQLKLSSYEGIERGASPERVYNGARITAMQPTRIFIDAETTDEWRDKGFFPVVDEQAGEVAPEVRLENSVMYGMLRMKKFHPQPLAGMLPDDFDLRLDRNQFCARQDTFAEYVQKHPGWGMPYAMPNLADEEYGTLVQWLAQGSPPPPNALPSTFAEAQVAEWEEFLNQEDNRGRLVSRYLYEHLFLAHLYFRGTEEREFFRLVRSSTPPGMPVREIATTRPFESPGDEPFWYRLRLYTASIVAKDHIIYELSPERMERYRELFYVPEYSVGEMPGYDLRTASNPFKVFADIPPTSRYRFLLDDARFFINGFIKGPVCRGQTALNVINDHFWVMFQNPDINTISEDPVFLNSVSDFLALPAERGNTLNIFANRTYWKNHESYLEAQEDMLTDVGPFPLDEAMEYIWDGHGTNPNAALTVFRHFDSASVEYGFLGELPESAWVITYPLFEKIHYLLVAGFDVFGNVGHQLNTRLYMDFLRMEGEDNLLLLLPPKERMEVRSEWYRGIRENERRRFMEPQAWHELEIVNGYQTDDPVSELKNRVVEHMGHFSGSPDHYNRCLDDCVIDEEDDISPRVEAAMRRIAAIQGEHLSIFPDVAFIRVVRDDGEGQAFTLVLNKGYKNLTSMFQDESNRDLEDDTLTVTPFLLGSYPNFFFSVDAADIEDFADRFIDIRERIDYERFVALYGIRRTNPEFWEVADWFQAEYARQEPLESGIFDLNRYQNR